MTQPQSLGSSSPREALRARLPSLRRPLGPRAILAFTLAVLAAALFIDVTWLGPADVLIPGTGTPWWLIAGIFAVAEIFVIEFTLRNDTHSFTLSELPLVIGLFVLPPEQLVLAQIVGAGGALLLQSPRSPQKLAFNIANFTFGTSVAYLVFRSIISTADPLGPSGWVAGFAAAFVSDTLATLLVVAAISLSEGRPPRIPRMFGLGTLYTLADTSLALVSVVVLVLHPASAWLLMVLAAVFFFGYRTYGSLRQRNESLETLQRSTRSIQMALQLERVAESLLGHARDLFGADVTELWLFPGEGEDGRGVRLAQDGIVWRPLPRIPDAPAWHHVADEPGPVRLSPAETLSQLGPTSAAGYREAMLAPIRHDSMTVGMLVIAGRRLGSGGWRPEQMSLLETLANHASISIQNGRLVERLRLQAQTHEREATHDSLTGLANRALFRRRLVDAVAEASEAGSMLAVMIMDLDRFKEVNDTLGHHSGDELLRQIAARLRRTVGERGTIARLSGDEFAVLLERIPGAGAATSLAAAMAIALQAPFAVQEMQLDAEASIGIALLPEHGTDAETLLQRADVAMYIAKAAHSGYEVYRPDRDQYSPRRLALTGELRAAIDSGGLTVLYQPQLDASTGRMSGAEALVRWIHPRHGLIAAGDFVPLAEHTGQIRPLTLYVLGEALARCRAWREAGHAVTVSVNLSARNLLDATLAEEISRLLAANRVPGPSLTIEITETSLMSDPARSEGVLHRLRSLGIGIAIDDFGTGYASLSYLKRFPVTELKIDQGFVQGIDDDPDDLRIVHSTIELAHALRLRVVAEGAENM
ncbi:MAG: hypothetical protein QOH61_2488, partial [Chloroflexota bacterium]|nr:hypothetical protein [Chloroflexota bacterium]